MRSFLATAALVASTLTSIVSAKPVLKRNADKQVVAYWGNVGGQERLRYHCDNPDIDIFVIAFVNGFPNKEDNGGYPSANFGNQCGGDYPGTKMFAHCSQIDDDIKYCRENYPSKKYLISIGGDAGWNEAKNQPNTYDLDSEDEGVPFADQLWQIFGPDTGVAGPRPFGSNAVDGFDFDIESGTGRGLGKTAQRLRTLMDNEAQTSGKQYLLTAAPQCIYPDAYLGNVLSAAKFDHLYVQFYNTDLCSARAGMNVIQGKGEQGKDISFTTWQSQAHSALPGNPKVFIGLPASVDAVTNDDFYLNPNEAKTLLAKFYNEPSFGGVMMWDSTYAKNNGNYAGLIKKALDESKCNGPCSSTTTTATTTRSSTTSSSSSTRSTTAATTTSSSVSSTTASSTTKATTSASTTASTTVSTTVSTTASTTVFTTASTTASTTVSTTASATASTTKASSTTTSSESTTKATTSSSTASTTQATSSTTSESTTKSTSLSTTKSTTKVTSSTTSESTTKAASPTTSESITKSTSLSTSESTTKATSSASTSESSTTASGTVATTSASSTSTTPGATSSTTSFRTSSSETSSATTFKSTTQSQSSGSSTSTESKTISGTTSETTRSTSSRSTFTISSGSVSSTSTLSRPESSSATSKDESSTSSRSQSNSLSTTADESSTASHSRPNIPSTTSVGESTTADADHAWGPWQTTTLSTTSRSVSQTTSRSSSVSDPHTWSEWAASSQKSVDPTTPSSNEHTWSAGQTIPSKPVDPTISVTKIGSTDTYVTTTVTVYRGICPTGYTHITATITATVTVTSPGHKPTSNGKDNNVAWPTNSAGIPAGFKETITVCSTGCAATPVTVTITVPVTDTSVVESSATWTAWTSREVVDPTGTTVSTPAAVKTSTSTWAAWTASGKPAAPTGTEAATSTPVAAATGDKHIDAGNANGAARSTGSLVAGYQGGNSGSGVNGVKAFTGGAATEQAPATAFSVAVCVALAVVGLVF